MIKTVSGRKELDKNITVEHLLEICNSITEQIKQYNKKHKKVGQFIYRVEYDNPRKKLRPNLIIERQFETK